MDSLASVELRNALSAKFNVELSPTAVFDHPTIDAIVRHILTTLNGGENSSSNYGTLGDVNLCIDHSKNPEMSSTISIVAGIGCLYPSSGPAEGLPGFWDAAVNGTNLQRIVPPERWEVDHWYSTDASLGLSYARFAAFTDGVDTFDASFFRMGSTEAIALDPQARILLHASAEALQTSRILDASEILCATGTYVGCMFTDYIDFLRVTLNGKHSGSVMTGNGAPYQSGRVAYSFGLQGPCIGIDTACSSSLVATHLAHTALARGEAAAAVAAGVNALLWQETTAGICQLQALSPVGRCQSFDASADGYGRGEGFASLVLVHAHLDARHDVPCVAVVRGSAVNQDGRSSSLTAPHGPSQRTLVMQAISSAALNNESIGLVVVHGTGTALGDPIEVGALGGALSVDAISAETPEPIALASVKSCYGHTEGTAGITGLLLAAAAAHHDQLPPVLCLRHVNPYVASTLPGFKQGAFVPRQTGPSVCIHTKKYISGTSSFGMSGINAHLLLAKGEHGGSRVSAPDSLTVAGLAWEAQRFWPVSRVSLLNRNIHRADKQTVVCWARLDNVALAFCRDHVVAGE